MQKRFLATWIVGVLLSSCSDASEASTRPSTRGGNNIVSGADDPVDCAASGTCNQPADELQCQSSVVAARRIPNVMILLDRSRSMHNCLTPGIDDDDCVGTGSQPKQRWMAARQALNPLLGNPAIHWGLTLFPDCGGPSEAYCAAPTTAAYAIGETSGASIASWLGGQGLANQGNAYGCRSERGTNTGLALAAVSKNVADGADIDAVLLVTDGGESSQCVTSGTWGSEGKQCSSTTPGDAPGMCAQSSAWRLAQQGVKTHVLGIAIGAGSSPRLNETAAEGGTTSALLVNDQGALDAAFKSIEGNVQPCRYDLSKETKINYGGRFNIQLKHTNGTLIPVNEDPTDGWQLDKTNRILTFHGEACNVVSSPDTAEVNIGFACVKTLI